MLRVDPNDRILPEEALKHDFFNQSLWAIPSKPNSGSSRGKSLGGSGKNVDA
jgi:hypothetical protein